MRFSHLAKMREAKRRRFLRDPLFPLHLELHRLDCVASHGKLDCYRFAGSAWQQEQARTPEREPLLKGTDLIAMGFAPGPRMGRILAAVEDARLEDKIATPGDARTWVREHFPRT